MSKKRVQPIRENWKPVTYFEGLYEVSNLGRVRSTDRRVDVTMTRNGERREEHRIMQSKILKRIYPGGGQDYPYVHLYDRYHVRHRVQVRKLVADAFLGGNNCTKNIHHVDKDSDNCVLYNLEVHEQITE